VISGSADAQPKQEGADDQRGSNGVGAGEQTEQPMPGGLIDQGGRAGEKEQAEKRGPPDAIRL